MVPHKMKTSHYFSVQNSIWIDFIMIFYPYLDPVQSVVTFYFERFPNKTNLYAIVFSFIYPLCLNFNLRTYVPGLSVQISAFEPRSQRSNPKKDPTASGREIIEKRPKLGQILIVYIFDSFWTISRSDEFGSYF